MAATACRVDVAGESVLVVRGEDGLHALLQRVPPPRRRARRPRRPGERLVRRGHPLPVPLVDLRARRRAAPRPVPRVRRRPTDGEPIALHPRRRRHVGRVRVRPPHAVRGTPAGRPARRDRRPRPRATRSPSSGRGATFTYDVAANWKVIAENYNECYHCGPVHPELCDLVPAFRRGGAELGWADGIPLPRRARGRSRRRARRRGRRSPASTTPSATRHKGELVYPNLLLSLSAEHVAAYSPAAARPGEHDAWCATCCSTPTRSPGRRSIRPTPATSGTSSTARTGRSARACSAACRRGPGPVARFAPMEDESADISRWYVAAMAAGSGSDAAGSDAGCRRRWCP